MILAKVNVAHGNFGMTPIMFSVSQDHWIRNLSHDPKSRKLQTLKDKILSLVFKEKRRGMKGGRERQREGGRKEGRGKEGGGKEGGKKEKKKKREGEWKEGRRDSLQLIHFHKLYLYSTNAHRLGWL